MFFRKRNNKLLMEDRSIEDIYTLVDGGFSDKEMAKELGIPETELRDIVDQFHDE